MKRRPRWVVHSIAGIASAAAVTAIVGLVLRLVHPLSWLFTWLVAINLTVLVFYGLDKGLAVRGTWRIAERAIHVVEAAGGSPAGLLARGLFRHKVSVNKRTFRFVSWSILGAQVLVIGGWLAFVR